MRTGRKPIKSLYGFVVERGYEVNAKVGTQPMLIYVDKATAKQVESGMTEGDRIKFSRTPLGRVETGIVEKLYPVLFVTLM